MQTLLNWIGIIAISINKAFYQQYGGRIIYPGIKKKYFWGGKLWTQSYFDETIGNANEETIRKYVQDQLVELDQKRNKFRSAGLVVY